MSVLRSFLIFIFAVILNGCATDDRGNAPAIYEYSNISNPINLLGTQYSIFCDGKVETFSNRDGKSYLREDDGEMVLVVNNEEDKEPTISIEQSFVFSKLEFKNNYQLKGNDFYNRSSVSISTSGIRGQNSYTNTSQSNPNISETIIVDSNTGQGFLEIILADKNGSTGISKKFSGICGRI